MDLIRTVKVVVVVFLVIFILFAYILVPIVFGKNPNLRLSPYGDPIHPHNKTKNWEHLTNLRNALEKNSSLKIDKVLSIVSSPSILRDINNPERVLYIAIGVEKKYTKAEIEMIKSFVDSGGKAIIADDFGYADELSSEYGVTFYGQTMWDERFLKNESCPVVEGEINLQYYDIVLNKPTGLANRSVGDYTYDILANGSVKSYVDRNNNGLIDPWDAHDRIPIVMEVGYNETTGKKGKIVFVSDTAIFTNEYFFSKDDLMQKSSVSGKSKYKYNPNKGANKEFVLDLIAYLLPNGGIVIFDESRHPQEKLEEPIYTTIKTVTIMTSNPVPFACLIVGLILLMIATIWRVRDKENWIHVFDISGIRRRPVLPDTPEVQVERLRATALQKLKMVHSLSPDEMKSLTPAQITRMVKDHEINELILNPGASYTREQISMLTEKIRRWGK